MSLPLHYRAIEPIYVYIEFVGGTLQPVEVAYLFSSCVVPFFVVVTLLVNQILNAHTGFTHVSCVDAKLSENGAPR